MTTWRNRINSLPWRKVVSEKNLAKINKMWLEFIKIVRPYYAKLQKTTIYKKVDAKLAKVSKRNKTIGVAVIIVIIFFCGYNLIFNRPQNTTVSQGSTHAPKLEKGTPNYATVLPQGKTIKSLGGWTRISPPKASPVYTYIDKLDKVQINVSEQPLPPSFKTDTAKQLEQLAQNENATEKITVGNDTIYIGTSSHGPQSVFFVKNNLLILIKSDSAISQNKWEQYINSLQ
ncbi:MAG: hypothetical protein NTV39_00495 [Candidatus Saccharibacteria bacterium]|nr:hypothetical protein [Candidatus Saccharibacteria bacterium]